MKGKTVIVYNRENQLASSLHQAMCQWLQQRDYDVISYDSHQYMEREEFSSVNFAISLGGDGTFLACARLLAKQPVPILPVHLGTFGFITEVTHDEWVDALTSWLAGRLEVEERMILDVVVQRSNQVAARFMAVNDAVVGVNGISKIVRLSLKLGGYEAGEYRGDGLILSTATGSTAYSMAAGGPILAPTMKALVLTPISPFSLSWRPMVIPDRDEITIRVGENQRVGVLLTVDGQETFTLKENDQIVLKGRAGAALVIKSDKRVFYEVVRSKLGWSGSPHD